MANRYGNNEKVTGGVKRRAQRRAKALGREDVLKGGVTGGEARQLKGDYRRERPKTGGIQSRARERLGQIGPVGGVNPHDGISRPEARKVRRAWQTERRFDPMRPRNGRDILSEADALAELEYGPQQRDLEREARNESGRGNVMASWFDQYQQNVAQIARENQIAQQGFQQGAYAATQQAFQADTAGVGQRQAQAGEQAAQIGTTSDPSVAMQAQQAAGARQQQGIAFGNALGQMGQAQTGLMNQRAIGAGQQRMEVLADSHARSAKVESLMQELLGNKGRAKTKYVGELQDKEHTKAMERNAFGLKVEETKAGISDDRADNRLARRKEKREARQDRAKLKLDRYKAKSGTWQQRNQAKLDRAADISDDGKRNFSKTYTSGDTPAGSKGAGGGAKGRSDWTHSDRQNFDQAVVLLRRKDKKTGVTTADRQSAIDGLVAEGMSREVARAAWRRFMRSKRKNAPAVRPQTGTPVG